MEKNTFYDKSGVRRNTTPYRVPNPLPAREEDARREYGREQAAQAALHTEGMTSEQAREALQKYEASAPVPLNDESRAKAAFGAFYKPPRLKAVDPAALSAKRDILGNLGLLEKEYGEALDEDRGQFDPHKAAARRMTERTRQILETPTRNDMKDLQTTGKRMRAGVRAAWAPVKNRPVADYASLGLSETLSDIVVLGALRKAARGDKLTRGEALAVQARHELQNALDYQDRNGGATVWSKIGESASVLPDFLIPMGGGNVAVKGAAKLLLKEGTRQAARKIGLQTLHGTVEKVAAHRIGSQIAGGVASTALTPVLMPSTAGKAVERLAADYSTGRDATGAAHVERTGDTPFSEAAGKAYASNFSAAATEKLGPVLGMPFGALKTATSKLGRLGGKITNARVFNNPYGNVVRKEGKQFINWNGAGQEIGEELLDNLTEPLATGEPERIAANFTPDNMAETAIVTAAMSGLFGAAKAGGAAASRAHAAHERVRAAKALSRIGDSELKQGLEDAYRPGNSPSAGSAGSVFYDRQMTRGDYEAASEFIDRASRRDVELWTRLDAEREARREVEQHRIDEQRRVYASQQERRLYRVTGADGKTDYVFGPQGWSETVPMTGTGEKGLQGWPQPGNRQVREVSFDEYARAQMREFDRRENSRLNRIATLVANRNAAEGTPVTERSERSVQSVSDSGTPVLPETPRSNTEQMHPDVGTTGITEQFTARGAEQPGGSKIPDNKLTPSKLPDKNVGKGTTGYRTKEDLQSKKSPVSGFEQNSVENRFPETGKETAPAIDEGSAEPVSKTPYEDYYQDIHAFYDAIVNSPDGKDVKGKLKIGKATPSLLEFLKDKKTPYSNITEDYTHVIDDSAVRHINRKHGDESAEGLHGQLPVGVEDFKRIPDILEAFEQIKFAESRKRTPLIAFGKDFPEGASAYVEEVRSGKRELAAKTMYKAKKKLQEGFQIIVDDDVKPKRQTPKRQNFTNERQTDEQMNRLESKAVELPSVDLTPDNWKAVFGDRGYTSTPAGNVETGADFYRNMQNVQGKAQFNWIASTLKEPEYILEMPAAAPNERPHLLYLRAFKNKTRSKPFYYVVNVDIDKDGRMKCRRWHTDRSDNLRNYFEKGVPVGDNRNRADP